MSDLFVVCAGGHGRVVIDILRRCGRTVAGLVDADSRLHGKTIDGVQVLGGDEVIAARGPQTAELINALGNGARMGAAGLEPRRDLYERFRRQGYRFAQVLSPDAYISPAARLEDGCHVITGAIVHPGCVVGANSIINTGAQLDHDCKIGTHAHIAPGAVLCGNVSVGAASHIGAGAVILQGITVGAGALIAAGAVVVRDVPPGATIMGSAAAVRD